LPGDGNVTCTKEEGASIGICRNPTGCNPQGNVCHYQDYTCSNSSSRNNCCAGTGNSGVCQLDALGVPRCDGLGDECRVAGDTCSSAADCCDGRPCVPGADLLLRCYQSDDPETNCVPFGDSCTINGDCCPGNVCIRAQGSTQGTCGTTAPPNGTGGAGGTDGTGGTSGGAETGGTGGTGSTTCSVYGQVCAGSGDCCNSVPCTGGICVFPIQ
jgi:hypothetical protein